MKFTSMQSALAVGALSAVAVPALADTQIGGNPELVLYVVDTNTTTAYARGLGIYLDDIHGTFTSTAYPASPSQGADLSLNNTSTATLVAAVGSLTAGSPGQGTLSVAYSLPTIAADANLQSFLNGTDTFKWSIQTGGNLAGNNNTFGHAYITTSTGTGGANLVTGTNAVKNQSLGTAPGAAVWFDIGSLQQLDNAIMADVTGSSITNSNYLATGIGGSTGLAQNWFSTATNAGGQPIPLQNLGTSSSLYALFSSSAKNGDKAWVFTLNSVMLASDGTLTSDLSYVPAPVPVPAAAWLLLSGLGGLGVIGRKKKA